MATLSDPYRRRARLQPALLVVLPLVLAGAAFVVKIAGDAALVERLGIGAVAALLSTFGLVALIEQLARDRGKTKERTLWSGWGGAPTTQLLRHRNAQINPVMRARYHAKLAQLVAGIEMPTEGTERLDPQRADHAYEACTRFLINATRDRGRFPLVFEENANYGFRRNLWGMRPAGIAFAGAGAVVAVWVAVAGWQNGDGLWIVSGAIALINASLLTWWLVRIRPIWVLLPARAYAERLLEACDSL